MPFFTAENPQKVTAERKHPCETEVPMAWRALLLLAVDHGSSFASSAFSAVNAVFHRRGRGARREGNGQLECSRTGTQRSPRRGEACSDLCGRSASSCSFSALDQGVRSARVLLEGEHRLQVEYSKVMCESAEWTGSLAGETS